MFLNKVIGVYKTVQGEGKYVGRKCLLVRLSGCPVGCVWCDTDYDPKRARSVVIDDSILLEDCEFVLITGGEPIYNTETLRIVKGIKEVGGKVHLETSGHITEKVMDYAMEIFGEVDVVCVSPKLPSAKVKIGLDVVRLRKALKVAREWFLKFVIANEMDIKEMEWIASRLEVKEYYVMLEGRTIEELRKKAHLIELLPKGVILSPRLHIEIGVD